MQEKTIAIALIVLSSSAWAQKSTTGAASQPAKAAPAENSAQGAPKPPDFSSWKWLIGTWSCTGTISAGPMKGDVKLTLNHKMDMDGFFIAQTGTVAKAKGNPFSGLRWTAYVTVDPSGMRYTVIDNQGAIETGTGPVFTGESYEFAGEELLADGKAQAKHSWHKASDKEFHWTETMTGGPALAWDWTCKK
jgi:hypothetical protein